MRKSTITNDNLINLTAAERKEMRQFAEKAKKELIQLNRENAKKGLPLETKICKRVPIKWLIKDPKYQRGLNESRVAQNAGNFDYNKVSVKLVSYRNGNMYLVDGKHTAALLEKMGYTEMYVMLMFDLTYQEEARLFINQYEGCTKVGIEDLYFAALEGEVKWATDLKEVVDEHKLTITKAKEDRIGRRTLAALSKMKKAYERKNTRMIRGKEAYELIINTIFDLGWGEFDGAFKSDYLEIGDVMCTQGVTYDSNVYNATIDDISRWPNPDEFMGMTKEKSPDNKGRHGEGSLVTYVRDLIYDLKSIM